MRDDSNGDVLRNISNQAVTEDKKEEGKKEATKRQENNVIKII